MITFFKKLLLISCLFMIPVVMAKKTIKTKKLQILAVINVPSYVFALNAGDGIDNDPNATRPQGSYYVTNAFIFPGGTVDKNQTNYSVDKHGRPINLNDSIGMAYFLETMLQTVDFSNPPANGTLVEMDEWRLDFKHSCDGRNIIYGMGLGKIGNFPSQTGKPIFKFAIAVTGASGCNRNGKPNSCKAKIYLPQTDSLVVSLIEVEFEEEIKYKK